MKNMYPFLLLLIVATFIGSQMSHDPGYVIFTYKHWSLETTLWFFIVLMIFIFFVLHHLLLLPSKIRKLPSPIECLGFLKHYFSNRSQRKIDAYHQEKNTVDAKLSNITSANEAIAYWKTLSRQLKREPSLCERYTRILISGGKDDQAESLLRKSLQRQWDNRLVLVYADLTPTHVTRQIAQLEKWLSRYPMNPTLQYAAGCLARKLEVRGKARQYFEQCISLSNSIPLEVITLPQAYLALSNLLDEMNAHELASEVSRDYLARSVT